MTRVQDVDVELEVRPASLLVPASLAEALDALAVDGSVPLGGGVRHTLDHHDRVHAPVDRFVAVAGLEELSAIQWSEREVVIGAGVRLSRIAADARLATAWPVITESAGLVATGRIRRMVTLGGNIAARDEKHDPPVGLAAAGATMTVRSSRSTRTLAIVDADDLRADEIIQDVRIALPAARTGSAYEKYLVRGTWEYACVSIGAVVELDSAAGVSGMSLAVGSVAGAPVLIDVADLRGTDHESLILEASRRAAASTVPRSDVRGSAEYKTQMIAQFSRRAIRKAIGRASALETDKASEGRVQ